MTYRPHILVVDDDTRLRELLRRFLSDNGFVVTAAADAAEARARMQALQFDLLVLDVMMPGESGLDLVRSLRASSPVPVLMLTALGEPEDRISGLENGADDYLSKPFEPRELLLRINAILRRVPHKPADPPAEELRFGDSVYDRKRRELRGRTGRIHLTSAELDLLDALATRPGELLSRELLAEMTGLEGNARTVDVQVTRLRKKLEDDPRQPCWLQTVRGRGYVLRTD